MVASSLIFQVKNKKNISFDIDPMDLMVKSIIIFPQSCYSIVYSLYGIYIDHISSMISKIHSIAYDSRVAILGNA